MYDRPLSRRKRQGNNIPFGYYRSDSDPLVLLPDYEVLAIIAKARHFYKNKLSSTRALIGWLHEHTGRKLSLRGLKLVMERKY